MDRLSTAKACNENRSVLCLSLSPLFADRMAFRECDTFFLGTARTNGGNKSSSERTVGNARAGKANAPTLEKNGVVAIAFNAKAIARRWSGGGW
jgi:hypothetical protein